MSLNIESFIFEIEKRPAIFNSKLKEYSDKHLRETLWLELCEMFVEKWKELTPLVKREKVKELLSTWKDLISCFKREYYAQKSTPPSAKKRRPYFLYYNQLLFLLPIVEEMETCKSMQSVTNPKKKKDEGTETDVYGKIQYVETEEKENDQKSQYVATEERVNAKEMVCVETEERLNDKNKEEIEIDEDKYFLLSLLPAFKKFNDEEKYMARVEIMNTIRRVQLKLPTCIPQVHTTNIDPHSTYNRPSPTVSIPPSQMINFQINSSEVLTRYFSTFFDQQPSSETFSKPP